MYDGELTYLTDSPIKPISYLNGQYSINILTKWPLWPRWVISIRLYFNCIKVFYDHVWDDRFILFGFNKSINNATKVKKPITYVSNVRCTLPGAKVRDSIRAHQTVRTGPRWTIQTRIKFCKIGNEWKIKTDSLYKKIKKSVFINYCDPWVWLIIYDS